MRRILATALVLAGPCLGAAGCAADPIPPSAAEGQSALTTVRLATVQNMLHVGEFVASERGFYVEHGLDVKLDILAGGADVGKAMEAGTAHYGGVGSSSVATQRTSGLNTKLVAPVMNDATTAEYTGPLGIVGRRDHGVRADDPASLVGKTVAVQRGSTNHDYLLFLLRQQGIDPGSVDVVPLETTDHPVSIEQGDVDAVSSWEPFVTQAASDLGDNAAIVSRGDPTLGYVVGNAATDEYLAENPDVVKRYATAIAQAMHWARQNPDGAAEIATNYVSGLDAEIARSAMEHLSFDPRLSRCTQDALHQTGVDLVKAGELTSTPDGAEMVEPSVMATVEEENPQWFADLPELPEECRF